MEPAEAGARFLAQGVWEATRLQQARGWPTTHAHTRAQPEHRHKKGKEGLQWLRDWLRKLFCVAPTASPGGSPKTSRATSDAHVPVLSRTADVSLSGRVGGGGDSFVRATADYKGIALQQENSRRKPKKGTLRGENPEEGNQDTRRQDERQSGGHARSRRKGSAVSTLTKPAATPAGAYGAAPLPSVWARGSG